MDKKARSRLKKVVIRARGLLEEDFKTQLTRIGIEEGGKTIPAGRLQHLTREDKELRERVLTAIDKEQGKKIRRTEAYDRFIRHVGFTYLNRIAALRAMEVRGLLERETVVRRDQYAGMSERAYLIAERESLSDPREITRRCLLEAFDEVSQEIKVLFDMSDEYSLLFPSTRVLDSVIELLSVEVPEEDWVEDDIIGWIYQYYNSEARREYRKKRRKPRADDIPVINQFYTPRWLVRALVDNTLGRLWLEMKGRMPKPGEAEPPSEERLRTPQGDTVDEYCSYLIPSRQEPPPRKEKGVREIKVLDPACGSGHFLVYAFNVLYRMYLEDDPDTPREDIPKQILENNLFGIDIDLRSVQLAALSLFLKAKEYNRDVKIKRMNLVCADARIIEGDLQKEFLKSLEPDIDLQRIFSKLFDELEYTYDVGSLLRIREPFERLIRERGFAHVRFQLRPRGQTTFSKRGSLRAQTMISLKGAKEVVPVKPAVTLNEMLDALLEFEQTGMEKKDMGTMLFAAEAEKSVGLLSLLSRRYDVVVMNPPYGNMPKSTKEYVKAHYPRSYYDYYAAFIERAVELSESLGLVGMLTSRTFMFLKSFQYLRQIILRKESFPELLLDLGTGILDEATCEWAATVFRRKSNLITAIQDEECTFFRLSFTKGESEKLNTFERLVISLNRNVGHPLLFYIKLEDLDICPGSPFSYWASYDLRSLFIKFPPISSIADVKQGLSTADNPRFLRKWWEVFLTEVGVGKKWIPFAKGGPHAKFYSDLTLVVNWEDNGKEIKEFERSVIRNEAFYFREGLTYSHESSSKTGFSVRFLNPGCLFEPKGPCIFTSNQNLLRTLLAFLNSHLAQFLLLLLTPSRTWHVSIVAKLPWNEKLVSMRSLGFYSREAHDLLHEWDTGNEISTIFIEPWILQVIYNFDPNKHPITTHPFASYFNWVYWPRLKQFRAISGSKSMSIKQLCQLCIEKENLIRSRILELQSLIDNEIYLAYSISDSDRAIVENELRQRQIVKVHSKKHTIDIEVIETKIREHVQRLVSYYIKQVIESDEDGIVPLKELTQKIRERIKKDFEKNQQERVESEIDQILGKNLNQWLLEDYFSFHVSLYERRPIFWHVTSSHYARKRGSIGAFNCLLHYYKLDRDTIPKIRTRQQYLKGILDGAKWKTERLRRELQEAKNTGDRRIERQLQAEYEDALDGYQELLAFDQKLAEVSKQRDSPTELDEDASWVERKIAEVRDNGYNPVIDYGVLVNITPLKEARLLHPAANRVK